MSIIHATHNYLVNVLSSLAGRLFVFRGERVGLMDLPLFLLLIARQPLDGFSSNLAHVCSSPGKNFEYGVMTFQPVREVT